MSTPPPPPPSTPPPSTPPPPPSPSFDIEEFKSRMRGYGEMEKFLVDELPDENELPKRMINIREKFKQVLVNINKVKEISKQREALYHLVNLFTQWNQIKTKNKFLPERLNYEYQLKSTLTQMLEAAEQKDQNPSVQSTPRTAATTNTTNAVTTHKVVFPDNLLECRWTSRYISAPKVHGLKDKIKFMERLLVRKTKEDGLFGTIAIIGIPGVGKSTLAQVMLSNEKVKRHYNFQLWVCLSKQEEGVEESSRKVEILKRMLICLGHDDDVVETIIKDVRDEGNIHNLIFAIRRQLKGKKYIVVLDDASEDDLDFLQNLTEPSSGGDTYKIMADVFPRDPGGMVIVTTRTETVAKKIVGEKNVHELPLLEHKHDCWEIFKDTVEKEGMKFPEEDEDIKDLIIAKCAAVPLAAKMMGLIMLHQIKERERKREAEKPQEQPPPTS